MQVARLALSVVLAACGGESPEQVLSSYMAQTWAPCIGQGQSYCGTSAAQVVECMNSALDSGGSAEFAESELDTNMYTLTQFFFTVDNQVKYFTDHPDGDSTHGEPYTDEAACAGPFDLGIGAFCGGGSDNIIVDGCPP